MQLLKQSTAFTTIVGPILDSTGAEYTGAVIGDLTLTKNGTSAAMAAATTLTHISNGYYTLVGTTGNSDTLGRADVTCNKSTYQMPPVRFTVLTATTFDAIVTNAATAAGGLCDVQRINGVAASAVTTIKAVLGLAVDGVVTTVTNQLTAAQIATGVWQDTTAGDFTVASSIGKSLYTGNVAPGAAGGHFIAGSNAATTFASLTCTGAFTVSDGIIVTAATANRNAVSFTGNGTGHGLLATSGAGADACGAYFISTAATGGIGLNTYGPLYGAYFNGATGLYCNGDTNYAIALYSDSGNDIYSVTDSVQYEVLVANEVWGALTSVYVGPGTMGLALGSVPTAAQNAAGLLDLASGIETGLTLRQAMRLLAAAEAGKLSGAATTTITIRNAVADAKARITATVDADGNRSAITYDLT